MARTRARERFVGLRAARRAMDQAKIADKGANIRWSISIFDGLRASLNLEQGGELAANLDRLYDYMTRTLVEANLNGDRRKLDEVEGLLNEIRAAWKGIEGEIENATSATARNDIGATALLVG